MYRIASSLSSKAGIITIPKSSISTTSSLFKWGDVYISPELKKWQEPFPKDYKEHPDRDLVNFPHPVTPAYPPKVRFGIFADSLFSIFYPKTGVTGGYLFYGGLAVYLIQKEWFIIDTELRLFGLFGIIFFSVYKLYGAKIAQYMDEMKITELAEKEKYVENNKNVIKNAITTQQQYIDSYTALPPLIAQTKKENVQLQVESAYRQRLQKAHTDVKRRLDYMADLEEAKRRFQRQYMIQWIVDQVKKSVTPQQEKVLLGQCVSDLKALAQRVNA